MQVPQSDVELKPWSSGGTLQSCDISPLLQVAPQGMYVGRWWFSRPGLCISAPMAFSHKFLSCRKSVVLVFGSVLRDSGSTYGCSFVVSLEDVSAGAVVVLVMTLTPVNT